MNDDATIGDRMDGGVETGGPAAADPTTGEPGVPALRVRRASDLIDALVLPVLAVGLFSFAFFAAGDFSRAAQWFPRAVAVPGVILATLKGALVIRNHTALPRLSDAPSRTWDGSPLPHLPDGRQEPFAAGWMLWIMSYSLAVVSLGFVIGTPLWMVVFARLRSGVSLSLAIIWAALLTGAIWLIAGPTGMRIPTGLVFK
jgi:hypothetical protein